MPSTAHRSAIDTVRNCGVAIISYNRKEGRALGEVAKYLVYNARPRRSRRPRRDHFERTRAVAGVEDLRFQILIGRVRHQLASFGRNDIPD